jgi:hypothetical protein
VFLKGTPGTKTGAFAFRGEAPWTAVVTGALIGVTMVGLDLTDDGDD